MAKTSDRMSSRPFASWKECRGVVSWGEQSLDVEFDFTFGQTTGITFVFRDLVAAGNAGVIALYALYKASSVEFLDLEATTTDGYQVRTDSLYLTAASLNGDQAGTHLTLRGSAASVKVECTQLAYDVEDRGRIVFLTQGQRAYGPDVTETCKLGTVYVQGDHNPKDFSKLTGCIVVDNECIEKVRLECWAAKCEELVDLLLDVFSIGEGRRIRWGALQVYFGSQIVRAELRSLGTADKPFEPMFSHMNLRPVLRFALENYSKELRDTFGIKFAVEWFLMAHAYREVRYIAGMTAIEHLVFKYLETHVPKGQRGILRKSDARPIRKALQSSLGKSVGILKKKGHLLPEAEPRVRPLLEDAVNNVNKKPLRVELREMLSCYGVPLDGLEEHLDRMVRVRNDVVHRGFHAPSKGDASLRFYESVLRELLKRIFLQLLGYNGQYCTWFTKQTFAEFQPGKARPVPAKAYTWWQRILCALPGFGRRFRRKLS